MNDERRDEEIAAMLSRDRDDPVRRAWEREPANRAVAEAHAAFARGDATIPSDEADAARAALAASLLGGADRPRTARRAAPRRLPRATAIAASLVVMLGGAVLVFDALRGPAVEVTGVTRGDATTTALAPTLTRETTGTLELTWTPIEPATAYVVTVLDADLREIARYETPGSALELEPAPLEAAAWYVVAATHDGEEIERTPPRAWSPAP